MTEQTVPRCTCGGDAEPAGGTKRIIFACAGASKTRQLSNEAAVQLTKDTGISPAWHPLPSLHSR